LPYKDGAFWQTQLPAIICKPRIKAKAPPAFVVNGYDTTIFVGAAAGCDLLSLILILIFGNGQAGRQAGKRSQPAAAPTGIV